ncbi:MAG: hypothetical protein KatS3mg076_3289 [Candidatus Binatia bacterium]|nr:MAG: hypothetical protein KatS3mg076_3289 [Candidatus Binatia bacterium]
MRKAEALGYRIPQATSLPDPMLDLMPPIGDMVETAAGMMSGSVGLRQKIPFPWKLRTRGKIAEREMRMALAELADVRIATVARVQRAYYEYYLAHVSIEIAEESRVLLEQIRDVASARYRSGAATQQDVLRAEVELYELVNELVTLRQKQETARALLNTLMDRKVDAPLPPPEPFELREVGWRLPQAMEVAVRNNPRLVGLREQIERDLEAVELARLGYFPDLTVGFTYTFISASGLSPAATGDDARSLGLGIDLPVWWQRIRAQILEARARTLSSTEAYEALRNEIFFQVQDTLVGIDTQYRQARLLRDLIVPRAWQAVEVATSSYRAGALEFTALIENWRKWLELSLAYHRALARLEQRFSDLQQLLGMRVARAEDENTRGGEQEEESREGEGILRKSTARPGATRSGTQHAAPAPRESPPRARGGNGWIARKPGLEATKGREAKRAAGKVPARTGARPQLARAGEGNRRALGARRAGAMSPAARRNTTTEPRRTGVRGRTWKSPGATGT